jgi:hypothetical protein
MSLIGEGGCAWNGRKRTSTLTELELCTNFFRNFTGLLEDEATGLENVKDF